MIEKQLDRERESNVHLPRREGQEILEGRNALTTRAEKAVRKQYRVSNGAV